MIKLCEVKDCVGAATWSINSRATYPEGQLMGTLSYVSFCCAFHKNEIELLSKVLGLRVLSEPWGTNPNVVPLRDPNVESLIEQHRKRVEIGMKKYGVTTTDSPLTLRQWLQHALEESMDQCVYLNRAIAEIDKQEKK